MILTANTTTLQRMWQETSQSRACLEPRLDSLKVRLEGSSRWERLPQSLETMCLKHAEMRWLRPPHHPSAQRTTKLLPAKLVSPQGSTPLLLAATAKALAQSK